MQLDLTYGLSLIVYLLFPFGRDKDLKDLSTRLLSLEYSTDMPTLLHASTGRLNNK